MRVREVYRLKDISQVDAVMRDIKALAQINVRQTLRRMFLEMMENVRPDTPLWRAKAERIKQDWGIRLDITHDVVMRLYRKASTSFIESPFDFNVSVALRFFHGQLLLVPIANWILKDTLAFLASDPRLEKTVAPDFEQPSWGGAKERPIDAVLTICDWFHFVEVDPWLDLLQEFHENGKARDT